MTRRRRILLLAALLTAGAALNVLVAWSAASATVTRDPDWYYRLSVSPFPTSAGATPRIGGNEPAIGGLPPPGFDEIQRDFIVEAWEMLYIRGQGTAVGELDAPWPARPPASWPDDCLRVMWRSRAATWAIGYQMAAGAEERRLTAYMLDTYRVGWPLRALELRYWYSGPEAELAPETLSGFDGLPAPQMLVERGLFEGSAERIPVRPIAAGFAANILFYTAILALSLGFFPVRRWVRAGVDSARGAGMI